MHHLGMTRLADGLRDSRLVKERWRYVVDHASLRRLGTYTLSTGQQVCIRHSRSSSDSLVLRQIFLDREYRLPEEVKTRLAEHDGHIVDLGSNIGMTLLWFATMFPDREITAFEPDPENLVVLERCAALNRACVWSILSAAASNRDGETRFRAGSSWGSCLDDDGDTIVPTLDVFPHLEGAALLKMDIEGGEWDIVGDPRFSAIKVPVIVLEYHPHLCPDADPQASAIQALEQAGYQIEFGEQFDDGKGVLWGVQPISPARVKALVAS